MALILEGSQPLLPSGGTSLPTASGADQLPVSDGAGTAYTATSAGDVVDAAIASVVGAVAGQAIVGDGLGGVTETSADVSAMLAAADAAAVQAALTAARTYTDTFASAGSWTTYNSTVAFTSNELRLSTASGVNSLAAKPTVRLALPAQITDPLRTRLIFRLSTYTGAIGTGQRATVILSNSSDQVNTTGATLTGTGWSMWLSIRDTTNKQVILYVQQADVAAGALTAFYTSPTASLALDGNDWLRWEVRGGWVDLYLGSGTSQPTSWTLFWSGPTGTSSTAPVYAGRRLAPAYLYIDQYRGDTSAEAITAGFKSLSWEQL